MRKTTLRRQRGGAKAVSRDPKVEVWGSKAVFTIYYFLSLLDMLGSKTIYIIHYLFIEMNKLMPKQHGGGCGRSQKDLLI